ncbi:DnaT-like ssDNA-binding protein [Salipiger marinus]|uniref:DnaT-like ssDNA-binding protein n=1 Tax=Salipiger marinus TaxID=555512 RepID=UPI002CEFB16C|nr:DnaT-like ssDNA-binding protein [Salipiger manganoxidans]MEB3419910.1 DnaT-like ssDNA-binding protein [Salipiger manganoxidans]
MPIVVEDGTGKTDATAFISLAYFKAYCDARGHTYGADDTLIEQAIVRATAYLSDSYRWAGERIRGRSAIGGGQALAWPRSDVVDDDGYSVPADSVPDEIQRATAEVARRELSTPGAMTPDYTPSERVKSKTVKAGPVSSATEYDLSRTDADSVRPVLLVVRDLIGPLLARGGGSMIQGSAVRV